MIKSILLVGIGGFFGSIARYLIALASNHKVYIYNLPLGTLLANLLGSMLFGLILAYLQKNDLQSSAWGLLLLTGFCGGFTTFSTFTFENFNYLQQGNTLQFIMYTLASFVLALVMIALGYKLGKLI